jgi:hypothetical protein
MGWFPQSISSSYCHLGTAVSPFLGMGCSHSLPCWLTLRGKSSFHVYRAQSHLALVFPVGNPEPHPLSSVPMGLGCGIKE